MPIRIDGNEVSGVTLDNQDVSEVTVDGDVVFSAGTAGVPDLSQFTQQRTVTISNVSNLRGVDMKADGSRIYICARTAEEIIQFDLNFNFDISTLTNRQTFSNSNIEHGVAVSDSGNTMITANDNTMYQFHLTTPYDVTSATNQQQISISSFSNIFGLSFADGGDKLALTDADDAIEIFDLGTNEDVTTLGNVKTSGSIRSITRGLQLVDSGTRCIVIGDDGGGIDQFNLSSAFDASTASFDTNINANTNDPNGIAVVGNHMYEVGAQELVEYVA